MSVLPLADWLALAWFLLVWAGYSLLLERSRHAKNSLTRLMTIERIHWMDEMGRRDVRIIDTQILASLQNGTSFFASTSLFAIGGALALLRSTDDVLKVFGSLPFGVEMSRGLWEVKVFGLAVVFAYAFFKFTWAYRLFNYTAVLLGATPMVKDADHAHLHVQARKAAKMQITAAAEFNRGMRAFMLSLGYLGWFLSPLAFVLATTAIMVLLYRRQFHSAALRAVKGGEPDNEGG